MHQQQETIWKESIQRLLDAEPLLSFILSVYARKSYIYVTNSTEITRWNVYAYHKQRSTWPFTL